MASTLTKPSPPPSATAPHAHSSATPLASTVPSAASTSFPRTSRAPSSTVRSSIVTCPQATSSLAPMAPPSYAASRNLCTASLRPAAACSAASSTGCWTPPRRACVSSTIQTTQSSSTTTPPAKRPSPWAFTWTICSSCTPCPSTRTATPRIQILTSPASLPYFAPTGKSWMRARCTIS